MKKIKKIYSKMISNIKSVNVKANLVVFFATLFLTIGILISGFFTLESKLYFFANNLFDYRKGNTATDTPIAHIHKDKEYSYQELFSYYHYNFEIKSFRTVCDDSITIRASDFDYDCTFTKLSTYSIGDKFDWGYYVDGGLFSAYYKNEIFDGRDYLKIRFGCTGFAFISDSLANKMLASLDINSYEELILNEEYAVLNVYKDGEKTPISLCINDIIYSNYRTGPRFSELYGDFAVIYLSGSQFNKDYFNWSIELDLKTDVYENKKLLKNLNSLGYNTINSDISFFSFDKTTSKKISLDHINNLAKEISLNNNIFDTVYIIVLCVFSVLFVLLSVFFELKYYRRFELFYLLCLLVSSLYFIVVFFVFIPPLINISPLVVFIVPFIHLLFVLSNVYKKKNGIDLGVYYEIEI